MSLRIKCVVLMGVLALSACGGGGGSSDSGDNNGSASSSSSSTSSTSTTSSTSSSSSSTSSTSSGAMSQGSHNAGESCLTSSCHGPGSGNTVYTVAGTVYASGGVAQTNATVKLYVHDTNTLVASLDTDASGNFFTTQAIEEIEDRVGVAGLDVEVHGPGGIRTMPGLITTGGCNGCHGQSNGVIIAN